MGPFGNTMKGFFFMNVALEGSGQLTSVPFVIQWLRPILSTDARFTTQVLRRLFDTTKRHFSSMMDKRKKKQCNVTNLKFLAEFILGCLH